MAVLKEPNGRNQCEAPQLCCYNILSNRRKPALDDEEQRVLQSFWFPPETCLLSWSLLQKLYCTVLMTKEEGTRWRGDRRNQYFRKKRIVLRFLVSPTASSSLTLNVIVTLLRTPWAQGGPFPEPLPSRSPYPTKPTTPHHGQFNSHPFLPWWQEQPHTVPPSHQYPWYHSHTVVNISI